MSLSINGAITNAVSLTYSTAAPSQPFKVFGTISNISLDANNKFCENSGGVLSGYARITDIVTDVPLTSTGQIIDKTKLEKWFEKVV